MRYRETLALLTLTVAIVTVVTVATVGQATASTYNDSNETTENVSVGPGQQLSAILATTGDDVQTEVEDTVVEMKYERGNETVRAEALAERGTELRERATDIRESYEDLTAEFERGEISHTEYARRLAVLNNRAQNVRQSVRELESRSSNVSALELRAAGLNETTLQSVSQSLENVTGSGPSALLARFTGQSNGEVKIERRDGLKIEVESEDGERSREIRHEDDGTDDITVAQADALDTAMSALSQQDGNWTLMRASVHTDDSYEFEYVLAANETGEAKIRVDGSSGQILRVEEEIERVDADERDHSDEEAEDYAEDDDSEREDEMTTSRWSSRRACPPPTRRLLSLSAQAASQSQTPP